MGKKNFRKNRPKTCSKHVWTLLGTVWAFLKFLKIFDFFENFRRLDPTRNTGQKKIFEKINPKHVQKTRLDTFGKDFVHFCNFEKFLIFLKIFEDSTLQGTLGKKKFSKKLTQNMFKKHVWTLLGKILCIFAILKSF